MKRKNECITIIDDDDDVVEVVGPLSKKAKTVDIVPCAVLSIEEDGDDESTVYLEEEEVELSASQEKALQCVKGGGNLFVTGDPGTGKSFLIAAIKRHLDAMGRTYYVTSTTGSSGHNIGGTTIHSYAGIQTGENELAEHLKKLLTTGRDKVKRWKDTGVLIIDEVSLLEASYFDKINEVAKTVRNSNEPFGGIQLVLVGDFFQLSPIAPKNAKKGTTPYIFTTETWRALKLTMVKLEFNFRQKDDIRFRDLLAEIRLGNMGENEYALLLTRDIEHAKLPVPEGTTKLFSFRNDVLRVNSEALAAIPGETHFFDAETFYAPSMGNQKPSHPVDARIELKIGASVLLCRNLSVEVGLFNGSQGVVVGFVQENEGKEDDGGIIISSDEEEEEEEQEESEKKKHQTFQRKVLRPLVRFNNGERRIIRPWTWDTYEKKVLVSSFKQIPLMPSYAITIHRAQGLTLDRALVDMKVFACGQLYVALSRVRNIEDLFLTRCQCAKGQILADPLVLDFARKNNIL